MIGEARRFMIRNYRVDKRDTHFFIVGQNHNLSMSYGCLIREPRKAVRRISGMTGRAGLDHSAEFFMLACAVAVTRCFGQVS